MAQALTWWSTLTSFNQNICVRMYKQFGPYLARLMLIKCIFRARPRNQGFGSGRFQGAYALPLRPKRSHFTGSKLAIRPTNLDAAAVTNRFQKPNRNSLTQENEINSSSRGLLLMKHSMMLPNWEKKSLSCLAVVDLVNPPTKSFPDSLTWDKASWRDKGDDFVYITVGQRVRWCSSI